MAIISVIIPVYNAATTIDRCISSVLHSTHAELEVLCINDGSTDESAAYLNSWQEKDSRVKVVHQENQGVSAARNTALQLAQGDYILFVDGDDEVHNTYIRTLHDVALQYEADCVCSGFTDCSIKAEVRVSTGLVAEPTSQQFLQSKNQAVCGHLYRRAPLMDGGVRFPQNIRYGEDTVFHYAALPQLPRYAQADTCGYIYHNTPGSASKRVRELVMDMIEGTRKLGETYRQQGLDDTRLALLVSFAAHSMKRIRSKAPLCRQQEAATAMHNTLAAFPIREEHLQHLSATNQRLMLAILQGKSGLSLGFYLKRMVRAMKRIIFHK